MLLQMVTAPPLPPTSPPPPTLTANVSVMAPAAIEMAVPPLPPLPPMLWARMPPDRKAPPTWPAVTRPIPVVIDPACVTVTSLPLPPAAPAPPTVTAGATTWPVVAAALIDALLPPLPPPPPIDWARIA